ncbi:MAG TPA: hypothetical protein VD731_04145 [Nitrosopumilaceae archaeon]|nr:hypothetical protein [Nitrosopumilaceae archaeon]
MNKEPREVIVKTMVVDCNPSTVFEFFINPKNWESGGSIKNVQKSDNGSWNVETPLGPAKIKFHSNMELGIFDHDFKTGDAQWTVYCRVMPNERGSTVSFTFIRPEPMTFEQFEGQLKNFDKEMQGWKKLLVRG